MTAVLAVFLHLSIGQRPGYFPTYTATGFAKPLIKGDAFIFWGLNLICELNIIKQITHLVL